MIEREYNCFYNVLYYTAQGERFYMDKETKKKGSRFYGSSVLIKEP